MAVGLLERPAQQDVPTTESGAVALLERARAVVAGGWAQDAFYLVRGRHGEVRSVSPFGLLLLRRTDVVGACLVGAVAHASSTVPRKDRRAQAALAVDLLSEALAGDATDVHPAARAARVRELARWNDEPTRTQADVMALFDRTIAGAVR